jgi:hypothetical protein
MIGVLPLAATVSVRCSVLLLTIIQWKTDSVLECDKLQIESSFPGPLSPRGQTMQQVVLSTEPLYRVPKAYWQGSAHHRGKRSVPLKWKGQDLPA